MATTYAYDLLNPEQTEVKDSGILSFTGAATVIPATLNQVSAKGTITSGALPTVQLVSGAGAQVSTTRDADTHTLAYANALVVKSGPGKLYGFQGYNSGAAQFILVLDAATLPADGAVPCFPVAVAATANFSAFFGDTGRPFDTGIVICNSSTAPTKKIGRASCRERV